MKLFRLVILYIYIKYYTHYLIKTLNTNVSLDFRGADADHFVVVAAIKYFYNEN